MKYQNRSVSIVGMFAAAALSFSPISQDGAALLGDPFREFNRATNTRALHIKDIEFIVYAPFFKTHEQDEAFYAQAKELKWLS